MRTAFPPDILVCREEAYGRPRAYLNEDALQLRVDRLAEEDPQGGWQERDISRDHIERAHLLRSEQGEAALYVSRTKPSTVFRIGQFDRFGAAEVLAITEEQG